jgi:hypothetical protein
MPFERVAGKFAEDVWRVMGNRSKIVLATASVACAVLVWALARWFGIPAYPGYEMSLALQPSAAPALIGTGIAILAATALGTAIAGTVRFDAGLFAAAVGLAALSNRGGPMRYVLQAAPGRGVFVALAAELLLLGATLGLAWFGLWLLYRRGRLLGDEMRDGLKDRPHSLGDRASALAAQAGATAFLIVLLARTDDKKQVMAAVCLASFLATLLAYAASPARPSVCFWAGPLVVGIAGYAAAYLMWNSTDPVVWKSGQGGGFLAPLARPLPLDYASLGTAGALAGYWTSRQWQRAKELESEAGNAASGATP